VCPAQWSGPFIKMELGKYACWYTILVAKSYLIVFLMVLAITGQKISFAVYL
jgi:hypothetical protein